MSLLYTAHCTAALATMVFIISLGLMLALPWHNCAHT